MGIKIIGTGKYLPEKVITNEDISQHVDTSHEWILDRTGIEQRRIATTESSLDMAAAAAEQALQGIDKDSIGLVVVATITPDNITPSMAAMVKKELGLERAIAFDINAACSGFVYGLWIAESLMNTALSQYSKDGASKRALVVGTERLTRVTNWEDRETCILFGDGAAAAVVECREGWPSIGAVLGSRGDDVLLRLPGLGRGEPNVLSMEGTQVFKFAVETVPACMDATLKKAGLRSRLILQIHDELIVEAPENEKKQAAQILKSCMENAFPLDVPLTVDMTEGKSWEK